MNSHAAHGSPPVVAPAAYWSRPRFWFAVFAFALAWAAFGMPWLTGRVTLPYDAKAHFQAQLQFLAKSLHDGNSPFWTPNIFGGAPQIADPQSLIFSPAFFLAWMTPTPEFWMLDALVLAHLGVGGFAILMFFKDRGWHPAGAMVAALAFAFGAGAAWRIQHVGQVLNFAEFGLTLWLLARALDRASWRYGMLAGVSGAVLVATPDQVALLSCYILAGYVVWHWLDGPGRWKRVRRSILPLSVGALAGAILAAAPLIMTILFATSSQRAVISFSEAIRGSLHPGSLLTGLIADLFGAGDPKVDYWGPSSASWDPGQLTLAQNMGEVYFGIMPALAILTIGLSRGLLWERPIRYFSIALVLVTLYGLGGYTPVFRYMYDWMPGVSGFRRPADAVFLIGGLGGIVGGYLVHRWLGGGLASADWLRRILKALVIAALLAAAAYVALRAGHLDDAKRPILTAIALGVAAITILRLLQASAASAPSLSMAVVAAFMVFDLGLNNGPNESTGLPPKSYEMMKPDTKNRTIALLKSRLAQVRDPARRDRVELLGVGFEWPNIGMIHGFDHVLGYNPLRLREFVEVTGAGDTIAGPDQRTFTPLMPSYRSLMADMLGLRWIASSVPVEQVDRNLRPGDLRFVAMTEDGYVYENPRALPRVQFVRNWQVADFERLTETGIWPENFNPRQTVLLEAHPETIEAPRFTGLAQVSITDYGNTRIEISVTSPDAGFVVLNDVWHRWWTAAVDGEEADILKANVLFRAVQVPRGKHTIVFEFKPLEGAFAELREKLAGEEPEVPVVDTP